ncbi:MAG: hypothetical protein KME17_28025 [Cyanosarcina radialis HA8281-LM2]|jgi:hypothetical protein|nr:hypothetical protein [Cyanosarcina radialis HA8281-LM2]
MDFIKQFTTITNAIALSAALGLTLAVHQADAQVVRIADEPGRNPYQQSGSGTCDNSQSCYFEFPPVPAGKRLVIQSVSLVTHAFSYPSGMKAAMLFKKSDNKVVYFLPLEYVGGSSTSAYSFVANQTVQRYFEAGEQPAMRANLEGAKSPLPGSAHFTITGYLVNLP